MKSIPPSTDDYAQSNPSPTAPRLIEPIGAGVLSWLVITAGFFGLKLLMQERPQFIGQPVTFSQVELVQESPRLAMRKVSDDVHVVEATQPKRAEIDVTLQGRRDYRGLRTIIDMVAQVEAAYAITNHHDEAVFVLFQCPHPHTGGRSAEGANAGRLRLSSSKPGLEETRKDVWLWSGQLEPHESLCLSVSYEAANLTSLRYQIPPGNGPVQAHRVTFHYEELPAVRFESGDGLGQPSNQQMVWERDEFLAPHFFSARIVESRNVFSSLTQLMEIGPLVSLLFVLGMISAVASRRRLSAVQVMTISAGFALYFPLAVYLSSKFSLAIALMIAAAMPGVLMLNYARWMLGIKAGLIGGAAFLALYQIFPTLAVFAGWNRGMVLLSLGVATLSVLIHVQNRAMALSRQAWAGAAVLLLCWPLQAQEIQVLLPGQWLESAAAAKSKAEPSLLSFGLAQYRVSASERFLEVHADLPLEVVRPGQAPHALFGELVHFTQKEVPDFARVVPATNGIQLMALEAGSSKLALSYRVPLSESGGGYQARVPLIQGVSGGLTLAVPHPDLAVQGGTIWSTTHAGTTYNYDIGVAGGQSLVMEWGRGKGGEGRGLAEAASTLSEFYGIRITRARHLTILNANGSCTHFAEFELPFFHPETFVLDLPQGARVISVAVNGLELESPKMTGLQCQIPVPRNPSHRAKQRVSLRLAYPAVRLGFMGTLDLELPRHPATVGTMNWVLTFPSGFVSHLVSSGLETQPETPDLADFGDYGKVLHAQPQLSLAKTLVPSGVIQAKIKYRQAVQGFADLTSVGKGD